ncbi:MAG: gspF [Chthoniobacteraceae bacterium]|nr:gspF [Chthoniobacteraceae bacterium]
MRSCLILVARHRNPELSAVRLPYRQKQSLYQSLGQLLRAGVPFPSALDKLSSTARGSLRQLMHRLRTAISEGKTVGEAFAQEPGLISPMETSVIAAVEKSGRLDHGFQQLAFYYEGLAKAREMVIQKSAYPIFMLHFGVFLLGLPELVTSGTTAYLHATLPLLGVLYVAAIFVIVVLPWFREAGTANPAVDRCLRLVPWIGKVRRSFSVARFCMIYQIELDAGVNVIDALLAAGKASRSGLIRSAVESAVPDVRAGGQVGPLLAISGAFPESMMRALIVGEESGSLDLELKRMATEFQAEALLHLENAAKKIGKTIYLLVLLYLGWRIVSTYKNMLTEEMKVLDF